MVTKKGISSKSVDALSPLDGIVPRTGEGGSLS